MNLLVRQVWKGQELSVVDKIIHLMILLNSYLMKRFP
uniref:Pco090816a n=1 Tax=Arundo donax TaxID=35708 RepID=A0A0A8XRV8_ARUDO